MKTWMRPIMVMLTVSLASGCLPEKRIVWSPDGRLAAVVAEHGLYFIDGNGDVLPQRFSGEVARCAWFPDGNKLVLCHKTEAKTWDEIAAVLSEEQIAQVRDSAASAKNRVLKYEGNWDQFELDPENRWSEGREIAVILYLRDRLSDGLAEKLGDKWHDIQDIHPTLWQLQIFAIDSNKLTAGRILTHSLAELHRPRVSPDSKKISFLGQPWITDEQLPSLYVVPTREGHARLIDGNVSTDYDWSPDSRSLAYIRSTSQSNDDDDLDLCALTTITVADTNGGLLKEWTEQQGRVGMLFHPFMGVRWLSDGRLLFSSIELQLPTTTRDMPQQWSLFVLDPRMSASVHRVIGRDFVQPLLDDGIPLFDVSPDETRVLLPGPNGRVTLYKFATGESIPLVERGDSDNKIRSLPSWRNDSEICYVSPKQKAGDITVASEVVIWKKGHTRTLSKDWPEEMKDGWLTTD